MTTRKPKTEKPYHPFNDWCDCLECKAHRIRNEVRDRKKSKPSTARGGKGKAPKAVKAWGFWNVADDLLRHASALIAVAEAAEKIEEDASRNGDLVITFHNFASLRTALAQLKGSQ